MIKFVIFSITRKLYLLFLYIFSIRDKNFVMEICFKNLRDLILSWFLSRSRLKFHDRINYHDGQLAVRNSGESETHLFLSSLLDPWENFLCLGQRHGFENTFASSGTTCVARRRTSSSWKLHQGFFFCIRGRLLWIVTLTSLPFPLPLHFSPPFYEGCISNGFARSKVIIEYRGGGEGKKNFKKRKKTCESSSRQLILHRSINHFSSNSIFNSKFKRLFLNVVFFFKGKDQFSKRAVKNKIILPNSWIPFYWDSAIFALLPYFIISHLHCSSRNGWRMIDSANSDDTHVTGGGPINLIRWQFTITASGCTIARVYARTHTENSETTILEK